MLRYALVVVAGVLLVVGVRTFLTFRPTAITLGPRTTLYFQDDPALTVRVHEAIHRRQMRDQPLLLRIWSATRYNFDYGYRLREEAEAKAGELCLQIHRFSSELPAYTTARSISQARAYRAWAWERMGVRVPDRVGEELEGGARCHEILRGVELDLPEGAALSDEDELRLATLRFLQSYGSTEREVEVWKARLELAGLAEPSGWSVRSELPAFHLLEVARSFLPAPDSSIHAADAGRAFHRLTYAWEESRYPQLRPVRRRYDGDPPIRPGEARRRVGVELESWPRRLLRRARSGALDDDAVAWLRALDRHPVHQDFERFARAPEADVVGERYRLPAHGRWDRLALSELDPVRRAFQLQWGRAALAIHRDDADAATEILETVAAGAVQMVESAPFEVDVLEGLAFLELALDALARLERDAGGEAPWIRAWRSHRPGAWVRGVRHALFSDDPAVLYRTMPALAGDPGIPWAFKRMAYRQIVLTDVCLEMHRDRDVAEGHRRWRAAVEVGLVRRPSDRWVLEMMRASVRELMKRSAVPPARVCVPGRGIRPGARMAIMEAPPVERPAVFRADDE